MARPKVEHLVYIPATSQANNRYLPMITITEHKKTEWKRFSEALEKAGKSINALHYSNASELPDGHCMAPNEYDALQTPYRTWLVFNEYPNEPTDVETALLKKVRIAQSGYGGIDENGVIVDRREQPHAQPIPENTMFGNPKPFGVGAIVFHVPGF